MKILALTGAGISKESGIETFMERPDVRDALHRSFATHHPQAYREVIATMKQTIDQAQPNEAHRALAKENIDIVTMNIDGLHEKAGSTSVIAVHGTLPDTEQLEYADELFNRPVLYGDPAPNYQRAINKCLTLEEDDVLLVVGASRFTQIAVQLREIATMQGAEIIEIQENATSEVPKILQELLGKGKV